MNQKELAAVAPELIATRPVDQGPGPCGDPCHELIEAKNGIQRHEFALRLAATGDRKTAYRGAGYKAAGWTTSASEILSHPLVWAAYTHHLAHRSADAIRWGDELRRLLKTRARASLRDYMNLGEPDPEAMGRLWHLWHEGVESEGAEGGAYEPIEGVTIDLPQGRRPPTRREIGRAVLRCKAPVLIPWDDIPEEKLAALKRFEVSRDGSMRIETMAESAAKLSAEIEGLKVRNLHVTTESAQATQEAWTRLVAEVLADEIPRILGQDLSSEAAGWLATARSRLLEGETTPEGRSARTEALSASQLRERAERVADYPDSARGVAALLFELVVDRLVVGGVRTERR